MKVENFEDLRVWKHSRELVKFVYLISLNSLFKMDFGLKNQIQRASVSIMTNIAEGFERSGNKEFVRFYSFQKVLQARYVLYYM